MAHSGTASSMVRPRRYLIKWLTPLAVPRAALGYQGNTGTSTWSATLTSNIAAGTYGAGFWYVTTPTALPLGATSVWLTNLA